MDISEYIKGRVEKQRCWYETKASAYKRQYMNFQTIIIILGATIPLLVVFEPIIGVEGWIGPTSAVISATIAVIAGIDKIRNPRSNWIQFRAFEEILKKEEWLYAFNAGPYSQKPQEERDKLIVERVESIISADLLKEANAEYFFRLFQGEIENVKVKESNSITQPLINQPRITQDEV